MKKKIIFKNYIFSKKELKNVLYEAFINYGIRRASFLADEMKELGFHYATKAGISISLEDLKIPPTKKNLLLNSQREILDSDLAYTRGEITSVERFQKIIDTWNKTSDTLKNNLVDFFRQTDPLNSIYLMAFSGARGNLSQVRQLIGMRGLMSDPNGQIMDIPIIHNFREGLTITDYIMSAYGARKGVVDTALRTADSGYLTRRLIDVVQDVIIREMDCLTNRSICIYKKNNKKNFFEKILGRTSAKDIYFNSILILKKNEEITNEIASNIVNLKIASICINSPLTCESTRSICQKCYGWNLAYGNLVALGEAVGIIAAQSIGEPGTQLTMRTFHTGGIFTADPSRQIRAKKTGVLNFNAKSQIKIIRTIYGTNVGLIEKDTECYIVDSTNRKIEIKLPAESTIFLKNKSFVKEGDLIAELVLKNRQTTKAKKNILASHSGKIIFSSKSEIIWILEGDVYDFPYNGLFNKFDFDREIKTNDNFLYLKLKAKTEGITRITRNNISKAVDIIKISKCLNVLNWPIFWDKNTDKLVLKISSDEYYTKENLPKVSVTPFLFCSNSNDKYRTKMGGQIFYPDKAFVNYDSRFDKEIIKKNGKILFIPVEIHVIKRDNSLLLVPNKTKLTQPISAQPTTELFSKRVFSEINGFVETKEENQILEEIQIKPGEFFEYQNLKRSSIKNIKKLNKKIFFFGEIIFDDVLVEYLTFIEIKKIKNFYGILLRPIQEFNIPKPKNLINNRLNLNNSIKFHSITSLKYKSYHISKQNIDLIESSIWGDLIKNADTIKYNLIFYKMPHYKNNKKFYLVLMSEENINIWNFLSKKLNNENLKLALSITNFAYVEPETILGFISIIPKKMGQIEKIEKLKRKTLIIKKDNFKQLYTENNLITTDKTRMIRVGDIIGPKLKVTSSGQIISRTPFKLNIHKSTPFFLTPNTKITKKNGDFIKQGELFGIIIFEQIVTGDIIQGLPKVEEILEGRIPKISLNFFKDFAFINNDGRLLKNNFLSTNIESIKKKYCFGQYFYIGKPDKTLTEGSIDPHDLLKSYFNYYNKYENSYEASYLSFKNIQVLLIEKVQQIYQSQGVTIADKHLEIILKRMTSKVKITNSGSSSLLLDELIELKQIGYINKVLDKTSKIKVKYEPILLGITKASLIADSFISAASFQETTKILTTAAIEGKIDWLRGLKENVIIGRLIPAGTGFRNS